MGWRSVGRKVGRCYLVLKRLVGLKSQRSWESAGCEPGKALSVKRNEMKAPALSVQMSSIKWSIRRSGGCRAANHLGFSGVIVLVNDGIGLLD
jgi:hypothetical protein